MKIKEAIHEILRSTWSRDISADDAADEIEALFFHIGEVTNADSWYVSIEDSMVDMLEDGQSVFIVADD